MSSTLANFLFEAANFVLLAAALGWVLFAPVRRMLDAERERHDKEEADSRRLRAEAESLDHAAHAAREATEREGAERRRALLAAAEKDAAKLLEDARAAQAAERRALEHELAARRDSEAAELATTVGRVAAESVRRLLDELDGPSLDAALVRAACAELATLPATARSSALVETARSLDEGARQALAKVLGDGFETRLVAELGAGVRVTTPAGQVDATAAALARHAARAVAGADGVAPAAPATSEQR